MASMQATEAYNGAVYRLQQARAEAAAAQRRAERAEREVEHQRRALEGFAVGSSSDATSLADLNTLLSAGGPEELLQDYRAWAATTSALQSDLDGWDAGRAVAERAARAGRRGHGDGAPSGARRPGPRAMPRRAAAAAAASRRRRSRPDRELVRELAAGPAGVGAAGQAAPARTGRGRGAGRAGGSEQAAARRPPAAAARQQPRQLPRKPPTRAQPAAARPAATATAAAAVVAAVADGGGSGGGSGSPTPPTPPTPEPPTPPPADSTASSGAAAAIAFAKAQLGEPYVYGAAGPDAWDCSGLTSQAWAAAGHPLSHWSVAQYAETTPIARRSCSRGTSRSGATAARARSTTSPCTSVTA